jgi:hypothetical protein
MSTTAQETCASLQDAATALNTLGDALVSADLDGLVAAEPQLEAVARALGSLAATPADRAALLPELRRARLALTRVQRLGAGLALFSFATAYAHGAAAGYGRDGRGLRPEPAGALDARG